MNRAALTQQEDIVGAFDRAAADYDRVGPRFFTHFGRRLAERAQISGGSAVLDVASGRGAVLFPAAERTGPKGRVVGIDLSAEMVRETSVDIRLAGLPGIEIRRMNAEQLDFANASFDRVLCGLSLWFFPHPFQALSEFSRVLRPGGRTGLTVWSEDCPFLTWLLPALASSLPPHAPPAAGSAMLACFNSPAKITAALQQTGFSDVQVGVEEADFVYATGEEWWASLWTAAVRFSLEWLDPRALANVRAQMLRKSSALQQSDGIHTRYRVLCAFGTKPAQ